MPQASDVGILSTKDVPFKPVIDKVPKVTKAAEVELLKRSPLMADVFMVIESDLPTEEKFINIRNMLVSSLSDIVPYPFDQALLGILYLVDRTEREITRYFSFLEMILMSNGGKGPESLTELWGLYKIIYDKPLPEGILEPVINTENNVEFRPVIDRAPHAPEPSATTDYYINERRFKRPRTAPPTPGWAGFGPFQPGVFGGGHAEL